MLTGSAIGSALAGVLFETTGGYGATFLPPRVRVRVVTIAARRAGRQSAGQYCEWPKLPTKSGSLV